MGILTNKNFLMGVAAGIALLAILKRLPAAIPGSTQIKAIAAKV